jgi:5-oxoprolinase (ATP-hydrolysing)
VITASAGSNKVLRLLVPSPCDQLFVRAPPQDEPLDASGTRAAFDALTREVNASEVSGGKQPKSGDEVAMGFIRVANEAMCRPIR